jgi:hypothetical protein
VDGVADLTTWLAVRLETFAVATVVTTQLDNGAGFQDSFFLINSKTIIFGS